MLFLLENVKMGKKWEPVFDDAIGCKGSHINSALVSACLTTVQKDNLIFQIPRGFNKGGFHEDKAPTLSCNSYDRNNFIIQRTLHGDFRIRRLTPTECSRLQTVPDWYKW